MAIGSGRLIVNTDNLQECSIAKFDFHAKVFMFVKLPGDPELPFLSPENHAKFITLEISE